MSNFRRRLMMSIKKGEFPSGYTKLKYLESTGTQYIDTNYTVSQNNLQNIDFEIKTNCDDFSIISSISDGRICGASSGSISYIGAYYNSSGIMSVLKRVKNEASGSTINVSKANNALISLIGYKVYKDNILQGEIISTPITINKFSKSFLLFAYNTSSIQIAKYNLKIYSFKLWDDNVLVRDYIPALDKNGTPCMYDTISKQAFYNQGTGEFIAGPKKEVQ